MLCCKWAEHGPSMKDEYPESDHCVWETKRQVFFETTMDYNFDHEEMIKENEMVQWQHEHLHPDIPQ